MGRNYYNSLSPHIKEEFDEYLFSIEGSPHIDHIGNYRNTVEKSIENSSTPSNVFKVLVIIFTQPTPHIIPSTLYTFLVEAANMDEIAKNITS